MLATLNSYLKEGLRFQGLEVFSKDGKTTYAWLLVKKHKGELVIEDSKVLEHTSDLKTTLRNQLPLCLTFTQKEVVTKKIEKTSLTDVHAVVNRAFPNINLDTVIYETYSLGNTNFISLIKKDIVTEFITNLRSHKVIPVFLSIGYAIMSPLLPFFPGLKVSLNSVELRLSDDSETSTTIAPLTNNTSSHYKLDQIDLSSDFIVAFGAVLTFVSKQRISQSNIQVIEEGLSKDFFQRRQLGILIKGGLFLLLFTLLLNFLLFSSYFDKVNELREQELINQNNKQTYLEMQRRVSEKEQQLQLIESTANSKVSFYMDELAQSIPNVISLESLEFQPLQFAVREDKPIEFKENVFLVSGTTTQASNFSKWVQKLERMSWIASVTTVDFDYETKTKTRFGLEIKLNDEH